MNTKIENVTQKMSHPQYVVLHTEQRNLLVMLKTHCGISHSSAVRQGIELLAKEFASIIAEGARLEA